MLVRTILLNIYLLMAIDVCFAQSVAINPNGVQGNPSAGLDIDFTNKGLLIPRVSLMNINDTITIPSPANALLIYNTNANMTGGQGIGFYFYCSSGCTLKGWKPIRFSDSINSPAFEWTYYAKHTFVNLLSQLDISSLPTHDKWKLVFDIQNGNATSGLRVGLQLNGKTAVIYGTKSYTGIGSYGSSWMLYSGLSVPSAFSGEVVITGKYFSNQNTKTFTASIGGNELYNGQEAISGFMINDPNNVSQISILQFGHPITGTIELWYKDSR